MGLFNIGKKIDKGLEIAEKAVIDKDKQNELKYEYAKTILTGQGASITKITICGLVTLVVGVVTYTFLFHPANMEHAKDYAYVAGILIGIITGGYLGGSSFKRSKWSKDS